MARLPGARAMTAPANIRANAMQIPDDKTSPTYAALMLLRAFRQGFRVAAIPDAMGMPCETDEQCSELHRLIPFLPASEWVYRRPVRALVATQWPKLSAYIIKHEGNPEKLIEVIPQIERLVARSECNTATTNNELREFYRTRDNLRQVTTANHAARRQQESTQRSAWNICKP